MTYGEKSGLSIIAFSIFFVTVYPNLHAVLWIIFICGLLVFLISGKQGK